jgi:hypothetical protein
MPDRNCLRWRIDVSNTSQFIADLVYAANEIEKQTEDARKRLLDSAVVIIRHLQRSLPAPRQDEAWEAVIELQAVSAAVTIGWASDTQVKAALLEAARMIRDVELAVDVFQRTSLST